jgi:outer membrane protein
MKRARLCIASLLFLLMLAAPYKAFAFLGVEAAVGYWYQMPSGSLQFEGDSLDLKNDLNLGDKGQVIGRVKIELPMFLPNIYAMVTPMSFDGTSGKTMSFTYGGQPFNVTANNPIQSKVQLDQYDVALYYPIPFLKTFTGGELNIDLGLDAREVNFESTISQHTLSLAASTSETFYMPMIYAGVQLKPLDSFSIEAEIRAMAYGSNSYYDYLGRLKVMPFGPIFISGGYRNEQIKCDVSGIRMDAKFGGPFAEAGINF